MNTPRLGPQLVIDAVTDGGVMLSVTNLAQGTALVIVGSVFGSGAIETEAFVAKYSLLVFDSGNHFAVN